MCLDGSKILILKSRKHVDKIWIAMQIIIIDTELK